HGERAADPCRTDPGRARAARRPPAHPPALLRRLTPLTALLPTARSSGPVVPTRHEPRPRLACRHARRRGSARAADGPGDPGLSGAGRDRGADAVADTLLHVVVPLLTLVGWLLFGPRP